MVLISGSRVVYNQKGPAPKIDYCSVCRACLALFSQFHARCNSPLLPRRSELHAGAVPGPTVVTAWFHILSCHEPVPRCETPKPSVSPARWAGDGASQACSKTIANSSAPVKGFWLLRCSVRAFATFNNPSPDTEIRTGYAQRYEVLT